MTRCLFIAVNLFFAAVNFTQPFWVDDTPIYPPALGVLVFGPLCLFAAFAFWAGDQ